MEKIAVKIKNFQRASIVYSFHKADGQYRNYGRIIRQKEPDHQLFLAITEVIEKIFMTKEFFREAIEEDDIDGQNLDSTKLDGCGYCRCAGGTGNTQI